MISFYRHDFAANYDLLITYYPRFYREVREMVAILHAHGSIVDALQDNVEMVYDNTLIDYMDEDMLTRMEAFLGMHAGSRTVEERRRLIKAYFTGFGKISASMIREMVYAYTESDSEITFEPFDEEGNCRLLIKILRGDAESVSIGDLLELLSKKIPAHIYYDVTMLYDMPRVVIGGGKNFRRNYIFDYPFCGTLPDDANVGELAAIAVVIEKNITKASADYDKAAEDGVVAGTKPIIVKAGVMNDISSVTEAQVSVGGVDYNFCGIGYAAE